MTLEDDDGYEWHEATTMQERAAGKRIFLRGKNRRRAEELERGVREIGARLARPEYQDQGIDVDGLKVLAEDLRKLL